MTQTVIDELVVRMLGDGSQLLETYDSQNRAAERSAAVATRSAEEIGEAYQQGSLTAVAAMKELEAESKRLAESRRLIEASGGRGGSAQKGIDEAARVGRQIAPHAAIELHSEKELNAARQQAEGIARQRITAEERLAEKQRQLAPLMRGSIADQQLYNKVMMEDEEGGGKSGWFGRGRLDSRSLRMLSHSALQILNAQTAEQRMHGVTSAVRSIGMAFGATGMIASTVFGAIISHTDQAQKSANKAFSSILDGAKTMEQGLASMTLQGFKKNMANAVEEINPSTIWGKVEKAWGTGIRMFSTGSKEEAAKKFDKDALKEAMDKTLEARQLFKDFATTREGEESVRQGTLLKGEEGLANLKEEVRLREQNVGLKGEEIKLEKLRRDLERGKAPLRDWQEFEEIKRRSLQTTINEAREGINKRIHQAGMTPGQKKADDLHFDLEKTTRASRRKVSDEIEALDEYATALEKVRRSGIAGEKKIDAFGLTAGEAEARELEKAAAGMTGWQKERGANEAKLRRGTERHQQWLEMQKAINAYSMSMRGATAEEVAFANAAEGGTSKIDAFKNSVMKQAEALASKATGADKKNRAFGVADFEADARELERLSKLMFDAERPKESKRKQDDALHAAERTRTQGRIAEMQGLTEELRKYAEAMEGASAADRAAANAKEGANRETARQIAQLQDAARTTEQYLLPQDKYMRKQRELDALREKGLIGEQTYGRALAAEQAKLGKAAGPVQGAAFGSAEALTRIIAQRENNRPVNRLQLASGEDKNKEGKDPAVEARKEMIRLLKIIADAKEKEEREKKAKETVKIGLGAGLALAGGAF